MSESTPIGRRATFRHAWVTVLTTLVAILLGVAAGLVGARREQPDSPQARIADAFPAAPAAWNGLRTFVFVSPDDCEGNLDFIHLFQRDTARLRLQQLFLIAQRKELAAAVENLQARGIVTPVALATPAIHRAATALGKQMTPFVVIIDANGVVRLAMHSPPDLDTYMAFPALLRAVSAQGVSHPFVLP